MANGLYSNAELIESLIVDLNEVIKNTVSGQYLQSCITITGMTQKLTNLRQTIDNDLKNRDRTIEELKRQLRSMGAEIVEMTPEQYAKEIEKDGVLNGGN